MTATRPTIKDYPVPLHLRPPVPRCLSPTGVLSPPSAHHSVNPAGHPCVGVGLAGPPRQGIRTVYHRWPSPRLPNRLQPWGEPSISAGQHEVPGVISEYLSKELARGRTLGLSFSTPEPQINRQSTWAQVP